jgi:hypothetical protein
VDVKMVFQIEAENRALEEYLDLRERKWQEAGENCTVRSVMVYSRLETFTVWKQAL